MTFGGVMMKYGIFFFGNLWCRNLGYSSEANFLEEWKYTSFSGNQDLVLVQSFQLDIGTPN